MHFAEKSVRKDMSAAQSPFYGCGSLCARFSCPRLFHSDSRERAL